MTHLRSLGALLAALLMWITIPAVPALANHGGPHTCFGLPLTLEGTDGPDVIELDDVGPGPHVVGTFGGDDIVIGTDEADIVCLGEGNDTFLGRGGDDLAYGDDGRDTIEGGEGDDELQGGDFRDFLYGDDGDDLLLGMNGKDKMNGGPGNDILEGGSARDRMLGGPGNDVLLGEGGDDYLVGKKGKDEADGGDGNDRIKGSGGADLLFGGDGNDLIEAGAGPDEVHAGSGDDDVSGGPNDDLIYGGPGDDYLNGDDDSMIVDKNRSVGDDEVYGGAGDDLINGDTKFSSAGADHLSGGDGNDRLFADWYYTDSDDTGLMDGGNQFDGCYGGESTTDCEWSEGIIEEQEQVADTWRDLVTEVFTRWGLHEEVCGDEEGAFAEYCVGPQIENALQVMWCESRGDPLALNPSSHTAGLFQNHPEFIDARVARIQDEHSDKEPDFPDDPDVFDPEINTILAALLVWESRQTLVGLENRGTLFINGFDSVAYPEFNEEIYAELGSGYSNWGEGPEPWAHWVHCAGPSLLDLYDPAWHHPVGYPEEVPEE